jgi:hypothetical protein
MSLNHPTGYLPLALCQRGTEFSVAEEEAREVPARKTKEDGRLRHANLGLVVVRV